MFQTLKILLTPCQSLRYLSAHCTISLTPEALYHLPQEGLIENLNIAVSFTCFMRFFYEISIETIVDINCSCLITAFLKGGNKIQISNPCRGTVRFIIINHSWKITGFKLSAPQLFTKYWFFKILYDLITKNILQICSDFL